MGNIFKLVRDRRSRFYGFRVLTTYVPEYPEVYMWVSRDDRVLYINKGAREGANVVRLS